MSSLDLGVIGNCAASALVDRKGGIVWSCLQRFDADPLFHSLLGTPTGTRFDGEFAIELEGGDTSTQRYIENTAVLVTQVHGRSGSIEITDFCPRFLMHGRTFRPLSLFRRVRPISGTPRVTIRLRPRFSWGSAVPQTTVGSNHIRYVGPDETLRLTTNAPLTYVRGETEFVLDRAVDFVLGPDETLAQGVTETARDFEERTIDYWRRWSQRLALPLEWQDAVIRAAITLKLCTFEDTGAIVAALTTSIPESSDSGRNWDYRYCWLRDAFFVVRALNSLSAVGTMENYLSWLRDVVSTVEDGHLQPVFGIGLERDLSESVVDALPGYRGMGPVRRGNQAHAQVQHDVYGNVILGAAQAFFDRRLLSPIADEYFVSLERLGEKAYLVYDQPDAGMWELRSRARVHTSSSLMSWAACDRLAKIARHLGRTARAEHWQDRASKIRNRILDEAWNEKRRCFVESFQGSHLDASVLLIAEVGLLPADDPRFVSTVDEIERTLAEGFHMRRYEDADDFGTPHVAFNACTFWRIDALARIGRIDQAREIFEAMLACRNHVGLLSEDVDPATGELWGNFPQTYSMAGLINGAVRLSRPWQSVI